MQILVYFWTIFYNLFELLFKFDVFLSTIISELFDNIGFKPVLLTF